MGILILSLKQNRSFFTHPKRVIFFILASVVFTSFFYVEIQNVFATPTSGVLGSAMTDTEGLCLVSDGDGADFIGDTCPASGGGSNWIFNAADGSLQSVRNNILIIGGSTRGNISLSPLSESGTVTLEGALAASNLSSGGISE